MALPPTENVVPENLLAEHAVKYEISIKCLEQIDGGNQSISIDQNAFSSSRKFAEIVKISSCDATDLHLLFTQNFEKLRIISFHSITNAHLIDWQSFPSTLPKLTSFEIINSQGLDQWKEFPDIKQKIKSINLSGNEIGDATMDQILQWIAHSPSLDSLEFLSLEKNALTEIPHQLEYFYNLKKIILTGNPLNQTIRSSSINIPYQITEFSLNSCGITAFEPRAFQGFV